ncbi:MAG: 30S ribosomal protein S3 [Flavobacteriales bacterium]|nr:30S ribosomal protein S3 [Flavobacteriales bacterium]
MGQKTNPIGNRLGIIRGWESNWYGGNDYGDKIAEDAKIRKYLDVRLAKASVSRIVIERTLKLVTVTVLTARPGIIIGKGGQEVDKIKEELKKLTGKEVQINIFEIKKPELDANLVANSIARQVESRISYRRAIKMAIASSMRMNAEGIKVMASGRLNGAEIARSETVKEGRIPLSTFRADIDYALAEAHTTYGRIGFKVWIMRGDVYGKRDLSPNFSAQGASAQGGANGSDRRGERGAGRGDRKDRGERRGGSDRNKKAKK